MSLESAILSLVNQSPIADSLQAAASLNATHQEVVGVLKSLASDGLLSLAQRDFTRVSLTEEAAEILRLGSPEARVWAHLPATQDELDQRLGPVAKLGVSKLAKKVRFEKDGKVVTVHKLQDEEFEDVVRGQLAAIAADGDVEAVTEALGKQGLDELKKRKLVTVDKLASFAADKGPSFSLQRTKFATDLTREMLIDGSWKTAPFKPYNFQALGKPIEGGHLHPLLKLRQEYREIFLELGFQEMQTDRWVESSFWNFDTLFVPQQHPARDMQDTFFVGDPAVTTNAPESYLKAVSEVHSSGGFGSVGYNYTFSEKETSKNVLRTHTTACSARTLYALAQKGFKPGKYFSIDRVFRNEEMDKTHLCEFHQIEGFVIDRGLSLADMMGLLDEFFRKIGVKKLRFKPAYNPYTEPSMEVFGYHEGLARWIEVGNSGVFRPEMLRPMGFGADVTAIAWGLSLERPAMMMHALDNIHRLVGHGVDLAFIKEAPICRLQDARGEPTGDDAAKDGEQK